MDASKPLQITPVWDADKDFSPNDKDQHPCHRYHGKDLLKVGKLVPVGSSDCDDVCAGIQVLGDTARVATVLVQSDELRFVDPLHPLIQQAAL